MSSNYIRIYCNGAKVRSTGKEKWQRDGVLKNFGIFCNDATRSISLLTHHMKNEIGFDILRNHLENGEDIHFRIEYIRKTSNGKRIVGSFIMPYYLKCVKEKDDFIAIPESNSSLKTGNHYILYTTDVCADFNYTFLRESK